MPNGKVVWGTAATIVAALWLSLTVPVRGALAAVHYIGAFNASTPLDDSDCGAGKGTHPTPHPCATLAHWNKNRRAVLAQGDTVRIAPGSYTDSGALAGTGYHCILLDAKSSNVTYEGRTATDAVLDDHESVVIDSAGVLINPTPSQNPCGARSVANTHACSQSFNNVVVRDLKFVNAPLGGVRLCGNSNDPPTGITLDRIRVSGVLDGGGVNIGRFNSSWNPVDVDCANGGRTVKNVTIVDSEVDRTRGFPGGIQLACMDGATIERTSVHDTCDQGNCYVSCPPGGSSSGCNDRDGLVLSGAINVTIRDVAVYWAGEDGIDVGGHPMGKSHHVLIERTQAYDNKSNNFKVSGGRYVTIRNSMAWGRGTGFQSYSCPHHIYLYNNTFWVDGRAVQLYNYQSNSEITNNIIRAGVGQATAVFVDVASTNTTNLWRNNIVLHEDGSTATAIHEYDGQELYQPDCDGWDPTRTNYDPAHDCSVGFEPPPIPCPRGTAAAPNLFRANTAGLTDFQAAGNAGQWFGAGSGEGDGWGTPPLLVDPAVPSAANLHLFPADTIAKDKGQLIASTTTDFDGQARPFGPAYDIGADELVTGAISPPVLQSVQPLP